jgi:hypothetical protein
MAAYSIHIGLNHVDPNAYGGWDGALSGCINDATDMKAIADTLGYSSQMLIDSDATGDTVVEKIGSAAQTLKSGDILLITYSGHGGSVNDVNGDEEDGKDETWALWDRQLIDDELYALWGQFAAGVRIVILSDSCHSGTMARLIAAYAELKVQATRPMPSATTRETLYALEGLLVARPSKAKTRLGTRTATPERVRLVPSDVRVLLQKEHAKEYAARQWVAGPSERAAIGASVLLISGCQDDQVSADGTANGLFTQTLKAVWNDGLFEGSYRDFHQQIVAEMPANQVPNLYMAGAPNAGFAAQRPFETKALGAENKPQPSGGASVPAGTGAAGALPTLKRGDQGPYVEKLSERLIGLEFNITMSNMFDSPLERAVRGFQQTRGLPATGVVDATTWSALD